MKFHFLIASLILFFFTSCIDDSVTRDSDNRPYFASSRIEMAPLLSGQKSPVYKLLVFNPSDKIISIDRISVTGNDDEVFSINIDGHSGNEFTDVEIRGGDSIYIFVNAVAPEKGTQAECSIDFTTAATTSAVAVSVPIIEAQIIDRLIVSDNETWEGNYYITDQLIVSQNAVLTLSADVNLFFADGASIVVDGSLISDGTPDSPVTLCGDRFDNIVPDVSYDLIAGQWKGIIFSEGAVADMRFTSVINAENNISARKGASIRLYNCRIHNASETALTLIEAYVGAIGCEITDAASSVLVADGSQGSFVHCTIANFFLLSYPVESIISLKGDNALDFSNSIIFGLPMELSSDSPIEGKPVYFYNCFFSSPGSDDSNFIDCIWDTEPMLKVSRQDYNFDYTPDWDSPVIGRANSVFTPSEWVCDRMGTPVELSSAPIGAYNAR